MSRQLPGDSADVLLPLVEVSLSLGKKPMWPPREPAKSHTVMTGFFPPLSSVFESGGGKPGR